MIEVTITMDSGEITNITANENIRVIIVNGDNAADSVDVVVEAGAEYTKVIY